MPRPQADQHLRDVIAARLRMALEQAGKTQQELSFDLRVPLSQINRSVRGLSTPSTESIVRFARYFNVSADWLLGLVDEPRPHAPRARTAEEIVAMADELERVAQPRPKVRTPRRS